MYILYFSFIAIDPTGDLQRWYMCTVTWCLESFLLSENKLPTCQRFSKTHWDILETCCQNMLIILDIKRFPYSFCINPYKYWAFKLNPPKNYPCRWKKLKKNPMRQPFYNNNTFKHKDMYAHIMDRYQSLSVFRIKKK